MFHTTHQLQKTIDRINEQFDYDLDWHYVGKDLGLIEVFEQEEGHVLTAGTLDILYGRMVQNLPSWGLEMVDS